MLREIQSLPTVHRGDVFWCPVKEITDEGEYIETKTRPILVVSNEKANTFSGQVTVVPITSKVFERQFGWKGQFLRAYKLTFGQLKGILSPLSGQSFASPLSKKEEDLLMALRNKGE